MTLKRIAWLSLWLLALGTLACKVQPAEPPTVVVALPTPIPTALPSPTPASTASPVGPSPSPPAETPDGAGGGVGQVVLLADYEAEPPQIAVADAATGEAQEGFAAPGLSALSSIRVGGPFVFYLDQAKQKVVRVGFDGQVSDLNFITSGTEPFEGDFLPSPDGARIAWGTNVFDPGAGNATRMTLKVANVDGSDEKTILDQTLADESILPRPIQWTVDSTAFYYTDLPFGIGGYILFSGGPDLKRVEVAPGVIAEILPDTGCLCAMAVSPDEQIVASLVGSGPLTLVLREVATGAESRLPVDAGHLQAGDIVWAPDGRALAYTMAVSDFEHPENEQYAIVRVNVEGGLSQKILVADDPRLLHTILWPEAGTVWLNDKDGNAWRMNPETGELILAAPGRWVVGSR